MPTDGKRDLWRDHRSGEDASSGDSGFQFYLPQPAVSGAVIGRLAHLDPRCGRRCGRRDGAGHADAPDPDDGGLVRARQLFPYRARRDQAGPGRRALCLAAEHRDQLRLLGKSIDGLPGPPTPGNIINVTKTGSVDGTGTGASRPLLDSGQLRRRAGDRCPFAASTRRMTADSTRVDGGIPVVTVSADVTYPSLLGSLASIRRLLRPRQQRSGGDRPMTALLPPVSISARTARPSLRSCCR